jgi:hypothetical protein
MVFSHLPSNLLLAAIAFAPDLGSTTAITYACLVGTSICESANRPRRSTIAVALFDRQRTDEAVRRAMADDR